MASKKQVSKDSDSKTGKPRDGKARNKQLAIGLFAGIVLVAVGYVVFSFLTQSSVGRNVDVPAGLLPQNSFLDLGNNNRLNLSGAVFLGNKDAPVTLLDFTDS